MNFDELTRKAPELIKWILDHFQEILVMLIDADGRLTDYNVPIAKQLGSRHIVKGENLEHYLSFIDSEQKTLAYSDVNGELIANLVRLKCNGKLYKCYAYRFMLDKMIVIGEKVVESVNDELEMMSVMASDISNISRELKRKNRELAKANQRISELMRTDILTDLANRRYFMEEFDKQLSIANRRKRALSIVMMDIDHFKQFNDRYGHDTGDKVLKSVGQLLKNELRKEDFPARFGGEEFIVILPETMLEEAFLVIDRIRKKLQKADLLDNGVKVTASFGVSQYNFVETGPELIKHADLALYQAKETGRNRVALYSELKMT